MRPHLGDRRPLPGPALPYDVLTAGWGHWERPVVSVLCPTLNHENFIEDALEGILSQVTAEPFEVIVRDDASSDGTSQVVQRYVDNYPRIVHLIVESENRWNEVKPIAALTPFARGDFIAICEGDDYWIDSGRLERQVRLLSDCPDAVMTYQDAVSVQGDVVVRESKLAPNTRNGISAHDLLRGVMAPMPTILYRNCDVVPLSYERHMLNFDLFLFVRLGRHGHAIYDDRVGAVHRLHQRSAWFAAPKSTRAEAQAVSREWIAKWLDEVGEAEVAAHFRSSPRQASLLRRLIRQLRFP